MTEAISRTQQESLRATLVELGLDQDLVTLVVELSPSRGSTDLRVQTFVTSN